MKTFIIAATLISSFIGDYLYSQNYIWQNVGQGIHLDPNYPKEINGKLLVGGTQDHADGFPVHNFSVIENGAFIPAGNGIPGTKTYDFCFCVANQTLYAATDSLPYLWKCSMVDFVWSPVNVEIDSSVIYLTTVNDSEIMMSGYFRKVNTDSCNYIAMWNPVTAIVNSMGDGLPGPAVGGIGKFGSEFYVGFYTPNFAYYHVYIWNIDSNDWTLFNPPAYFLNMYISSVWADDQAVIIAFWGVDNIGGPAKVVQFDGSNWMLIGSFSGPISSITRDPDSSIVINGLFSEINDQPIQSWGIAKCKNGEWLPYGDGPSGQTGLPKAIINYESTIYAFGNLFTDWNFVGVKRWVLETGISNPSFDSKIFPNPASDYLTINCPVGIDLSVSDIVGNRLQSIKTSGLQTILNTKDFPSGIYQVYLNEKHKTVAIIH